MNRLKLFYQININSTPEQVFQWLDQPEKALMWMKSVRSTKILNDMPGRVGTTFIEMVEENGKSTELQGVITAFKPGHMISFKLTGIYNDTEVLYQVNGSKEKTLLTIDASIRFKSFTKIVMFFMGPIFKKKIKTQFKNEIEMLKKLCE
ncbi:MAG: SRPBCC family protein [FCB group bacterium]|nr:SRPBCC family protein [FCB group bacterium]